MDQQKGHTAVRRAKEGQLRLLLVRRRRPKWHKLRRLLLLLSTLEGWDCCYQRKKADVDCDSAGACPMLRCVKG